MFVWKCLYDTYIRLILLCYLHYVLYSVHEKINTDLGSLLLMLLWVWLCAAMISVGPIWQFRFMSKPTRNVIPQNIYVFLLLLPLSPSFLHICFLHSPSSLCHPHPTDWQRPFFPSFFLSLSFFSSPPPINDQLFVFFFIHFHTHKHKHILLKVITGKQCYIWL